MKNLTERNMAEFISEGITNLAEEMAEDNDESTCIKNIKYFEDEGVLTSDTGIVICMSDGKKFQVTIKEA